MHSENVATVVLTSRFVDAVACASHVHIETLKGTRIPYMAHLLGVAEPVLGEQGNVTFSVTEDIAIGALLHDAVEDAGGPFSLARHQSQIWEDGRRNRGGL